MWQDVHSRPRDDVIQHSIVHTKPRWAVATEGSEGRNRDFGYGNLREMVGLEGRGKGEKEEEDERDRRKLRKKFKYKKRRRK